MPTGTNNSLDPKEIVVGKEIHQDIIDRYYPRSSFARNILITHSLMVCDKALSVMQSHPELKADGYLVENGAMLHDIGIFLTSATEIGCYGEHPYICHGVLGRKILEENGASEVALFAERHTGAGFSIEEIKRQNLPLPERDMLPVTIEEMLICFADKFYSKGKYLTKEKPLNHIREGLSVYGKPQLDRFNRWCEMFL
jgi:uncharacterized protein